jgi:hypothetical protein
LHRSLLQVAIGLVTIVSTARASDFLVDHEVREYGQASALSVFDGARNRLVVVEPRPGTNQTRIELLQFGGQPRWRTAAATGDAILGFAGGVAVLDSLHDRLLFVSGGELWSVGLAEPMTWSHVTPAGTPPAVVGRTIVYDSLRDRLVGHGGTDGSVHVQWPPTTNATWTLSLGANPTWTVLTPAGGAPPTRDDHAAIYDPVGDRMIVFGGHSNVNGVNTPRNDAWQLTFAGGIPTWNPLATSGAAPSPRQSMAWVFDPAHRRLVVEGGASVVNVLAGSYALDIDTGAWQAIADVPPSPRRSPAFGFDPGAGRMIVAGGGITNTPFAVGDAWELPLGTVPGPWSEIPAIGAPGEAAVLAEYDPIAHRFAAIRGGAPWFLSVVDTQWVPSRLVGAPPTAPVGTVYDPVSNTMWAFSRDSLFTTHPAVESAWQRAPITGANPVQGDTVNTVFLDAARSRVLMIGTRSTSPYPGSGSSVELRVLHLGPTPSWTIEQASTPLGIRITPAIHDTRRDRLLFFGGGDPDAPYGDLHSLNLASLTWSVPAATGTPPAPRLGFAAAYDSLRDRVDLLGGVAGTTEYEDGYHLQFAAGDANGHWSAATPAGARAPLFPLLAGGFDPGLDRFFSFFHARLFELVPDAAPAAIDVECPPRTAWAPGAVLPLKFRVAQLASQTRNYGWRTTSSRAWPGFPLLGFQDLAGTQPVDIAVGVPVPDTAAAGIDSLRFTIWDLADTPLPATCTVAIGDTVTPVLWALLESRAELTRVQLTWWSAGRAPAEVQRRAGDDSWASRGLASIGGDGLARYEDDAIEPGTRYAYRIGRTGEAWSEEAWVDVPSPSLAFLRPGAVVRGALDVDFALPAAGTATLEAFDIAGRRVARVRGDGLVAGTHSLRLAEAGALRSGIYFLRLSQGAGIARSRAIVLGVTR